MTTRQGIGRLSQICGPPARRQSRCGAISPVGLVRSDHRMHLEIDEAAPVRHPRVKQAAVMAFHQLIATPRSRRYTAAESLFLKRSTTMYVIYRDIVGGWREWRVGRENISPDVRDRDGNHADAARSTAKIGVEISDAYGFAAPMTMCVDTVVCCCRFCPVAMSPCRIYIPGAGALIGNSANQMPGET